MDNLFKSDALKYHSEGRPGKIEVIPTTAHSTQRDLSLAYSPGVAEPCLEIEKNPEDVYKYTAIGNLVAVISNGTAVLGLGDIGAQAGKPVMEGKGLLFKIYADIDVFDIEVDTKDIDKFIETVKMIAPTFGGINLEDIKAPECFEIERRLKKELNIPLMHDDQHGTAIISSAGLLNAMEVVGKKIEDIIVVVNGAGASAISCTRLYKKLGVRPENIVMCDSRGVIRSDRPSLSLEKKEFATDRDLNTLAEAIVGADMFLGLSVAGVLKQEMLKSMNKNPIVFALANPNPEITFEDAHAVRKDVIMATGRSDYPNQINNVLGFPYIFRGALDVRATGINEEMKLAAAYAIAALAKEPVPEEVNQAFHSGNLTFGIDYLIPKPTDPRLIETVAPAVAKAAMDSGIAKNPTEDWNAYKETLRMRLGIGNPLLRQIKEKAKKNVKRIVFADAENYKMLKAAEILINEKMIIPILLGNRETILKIAHENNLEIDNIEIIDPKADDQLKLRTQFAELLFEKRKRKGMKFEDASDKMKHRSYFAPGMVESNIADGMVSGHTKNYPDAIRPALQVIGKAENAKLVSGMYIFLSKKGPLFLADTTVNKNPTFEQLVEITLQTAESIRQFGIEPRIALLSYSNFGSNEGFSPNTMRDIAAYLHKNHPDLIVDGEMQANFALNKDLLKRKFPFSKLAETGANTLIFPNLSSGNIAYKLMQSTTDYKVIGPILNGFKKSAHILQLSSSVDEIVDIAMIASINASYKNK
ncbi:MAG: NADP-dependent malic enzyme [Bacteroidales bacterium]|jgi:malate dehydrogenase (oxaloacetate-decarboxylating)(NADP+)|nr:NADP-dependent malic enzyme [Bacteroidales bacterium]